MDLIINIDIFYTKIIILLFVINNLYNYYQKCYNFNKITNMNNEITNKLIQDNSPKDDLNEDDLNEDDLNEDDLNEDDLN